MLKVACIPAFNEEKTIAKVVIGAQNYVDQVVVCDDGSEDMTAAIAEKLGATVIRQPRNMGKGQALRALFLKSRELQADVMITLDGDGQHDPRDIPKLLDGILNDTADIVIGARFHGDANKVPTYRKVGNRLLNVLTLDGVSDTQSGFRAYNRRAIGSILPAEMGMGVDSEILIDASKAELRIEEVPVSVKYGIGKTSTHNPVFHTLDVFFTLLKLTSLRHPLIFYGLPGLAFIAIGAYFTVRAYLILSVQQVITDITLTYGLFAFAFIMLGLLTIFTGIILFTLTTVVRKNE